MFWLPWQDASNDLLLALHYPNNLILWNADQATKIWKKSYNDNLTTFSLDPFQFSNAAFLTQSGNLMLIDDFSFSKTPSGNGQQFRVSPSSGAAVSIDEVDPKRASLATVFIKRPLIKVLATAGGKILENAENLSTSASSNPTSPTSVASTITDDNWAQVIYHPAVRNVLFLVYPREIVVLDSQTVQTITQIVFEKSASPLLQVIPCWLRDAVYFIQVTCVFVYLFFFGQIFTVCICRKMARLVFDCRNVNLHRSTRAVTLIWMCITRWMSFTNWFAVRKVYALQKLTEHSASRFVQQRNENWFCCYQVENC